MSATAGLSMLGGLAGGISELWKYLGDEYGYDDIPMKEGVFNSGITGMTGSLSGGSLDMSRRMITPAYKRKNQFGEMADVAQALNATSASVLGSSGVFPEMTEDNKKLDKAYQKINKEVDKLAKSSVPFKADFNDAPELPVSMSKSTDAPELPISMPESTNINFIDIGGMGQGPLKGDNLFNSDMKTTLRGGGKNVEAEGGEIKISFTPGIYQINNVRPVVGPSHEGGGVNAKLAPGEAILNKEQQQRLASGEPLVSVLDDVPDVGNMAQYGLVEDDPPYWTLRQGENMKDRNTRIQKEQTQNMKDFWGDINAPIYRMFDSEYRSPTEGHYDYLKEQSMKQVRKKLAKPYSPPNPQFLPYPPETDNIEETPSNTTKEAPSNSPGYADLAITRKIYPLTKIPTLDADGFSYKKTLDENLLARGKNKISKRPLGEFPSEIKKSGEEFSFGGDEAAFVGNLLYNLSTMLQPRPEKIRMSPSYITPTQITPRFFNEASIQNSLSQDLKTVMSEFQERGIDPREMIAKFLESKEKVSLAAGMENMKVASDTQKTNAQYAMESIIRNQAEAARVNQINTALEEKESNMRFAQNVARNEALANQFMNYKQYEDALWNKKIQALMLSKM